MLFLLGVLGFLVSSVAQLGPSNWTASPFNPPALPLGVRSPYLNAWLLQGNNPSPAGVSWPKVWGNPQIDKINLGWQAFVTVDGVAYSFLGNAFTSSKYTIAEQVAVEFSPTRTSILSNAGSVSINASFLSPVEPSDLVRLSMPFFYFYVSVAPTDNNPHEVRLYSDISAEWIAGNEADLVRWQSIASGDTILLQTSPQQLEEFGEQQDHATDSTSYIGMGQVTDLTWQIGRDQVVREMFINGTNLQNTSDSDFRAAGTDFPVFAISVDLGTITESTSPIVWSIGVTRSPSINYIQPSGSDEVRYAFYLSKYATPVDAMNFFIGDFSNALSSSIAFDAKIMADAGQFSSEYTDLICLSLRQVMGSGEITVPKNGNGNFNTSDIKMFIKDMGNIGSGGVNEVDVLYAALPAFLYLNPDLAGYLLSPLLEFEASSQYTEAFATTDLGSNYPNATGSSSGDQSLSIEESANMIIMALAHAQISGDGTLLGQYYTLLRSWANFLVNNTLSPGNQFTSRSDGIASTNQTNLALKGIIGIAAMAKISQYASQTNDTIRFNTTAKIYTQQWIELATASDGSHLRLNYGLDSSNGLIYNLYADQLLQLNLIPDSAKCVRIDYSSLSALELSFDWAKASMSPFGLPLDLSKPTLSRSDWMLFAASTVTNSTTQDSMVSLVHQYASSNIGNLPFSVLYDPTTGAASGGNNSPAQGAMFAFLATKLPVKPVTVNPVLSSSSSVSNTKNKSNIGAIVGGVVGGIAALGVIAGLVFVLLTRRKRRARMEEFIEYTRPEPLVQDPLTPMTGVIEHAQSVTQPQPSVTSTGQSSSTPLTTPQTSSKSSSRPLLSTTTRGKKKQKTDRRVRNPDSRGRDRTPDNGHSQHITPFIAPQPSTGELSHGTTNTSSTPTTSSAEQRLVSSPERGRPRTTRVSRDRGSSRPRARRQPRALPTPPTSSGPSDNRDLRIEVDNLRREMQQLRQEAGVFNAEELPGYSLSDG